MDVSGNQFNYHVSHGKMEEALAQYRKDNPQNAAVQAHEQQIAKTQNRAIPVMQNLPKATTQQLPKARPLYPATLAPRPEPPKTPLPLPPRPQRADSKPSAPTVAPPPRMNSPQKEYVTLSPRTQQGLRPSAPTAPPPQKNYVPLPPITQQGQRPSAPTAPPPQRDYVNLPPRPAAQPQTGYPALPNRMSPPTPNPSERQYVELPKELSPQTPPKPIQRPQRSFSAPPNLNPSREESSATVTNFDKFGNIAGQGSEVVTDPKKHMTPSELADFALSKKSVNPQVLRAMKGTLQHHLNQINEAERNLDGGTKKTHRLSRIIHKIHANPATQIERALDHLNQLSGGAAPAA